MRHLTLAGLTMLIGTIASGAALGAQQAQVYSTSGCGCCVSWVRHLEENGYRARVENLDMGALMLRKVDAGLGPDLAACHTAEIDGYLVEGHVPAREIDRLLAERPDAVGLVVPGMPSGSPGMGEPTPDMEPYDVLLLKQDGSTEVYASYP